MQNGQRCQVTQEDEVIRSIQAETSTRFQLAGSALICNGLLYKQFGYLADSDAAEQVLMGTYRAPPGTDAATLLLLEEIGRIGRQWRAHQISLSISTEDFQEYWRHMKERTSSSYSGLHFGHYKALSRSDSLSELFARKVSLVSALGLPPDRWGVGLTVMLEKIVGEALVSKLRAILLMEADFSMHNRIIFGRRMIDHVRASGLIPPEQFSTCNSTSEDGSLQKALLLDISRQGKIPCVVTSNDATACYDWVAHSIALLSFQALGVAVRQQSARCSGPCKK
eukprot:scaffold117520_cov80-Cyclotella_meneghiniana.AAC.3